MIEIDNLSLDEWYTCLKPYQKNAIEQLVAKYGEEKAAEEWLTARGPMQTATFGGTQTKAEDTHSYWNRLRTEIDKLIPLRDAKINEKSEKDKSYNTTLFCWF